MDFHLSLFNVDINLLYSISGLLVGILVGLTGVGGGSLMTPILVLVFGVHPATAVGTDLLYAAITKSVGTVVHGIKASVDWKIVGRLALGSIPAAAITLYFISQHGQDKAFAAQLKVILGYALFMTAIILLAREYLQKLAGKYTDEHKESPAIFTVIVGLVLGALVSLTSIGAGALGVTALILLYRHLPTLRIVGSDIAHAVPLTFVAGMGYFMVGNVNVAMLISLLIGSIPGIVIGSWLAPGMSEKFLRYLLATVLTLVGYKLVTSH